MKAIGLNVKMKTSKSIQSLIGEGTIDRPRDVVRLRKTLITPGEVSHHCETIRAPGSTPS